MKQWMVSVCFCGVLFLFGGMFLIHNTTSISGLVHTGISRESTTEFESLLTNNFPSRNKWINMNGLFLKSIGTTADLQKDWFRAEDGAMIYSMPKLSDKKVEQYAESVAELQNYTKHMDVPLYYVQLPFKSLHGTQMPPGVTMYGKERAEKMCHSLHNKKIPVLDLYEALEHRRGDSTTLFFKTDQHWRPATALWASERISAYLQLQDPTWNHSSKTFALNRFHKIIYHNWFLGALGKKTGNWYAGVDDFELIWPKSPTSYSFTADTATGLIKREGDFQNVMFQKSNLKKDYFNINTYATYIGGDYKENTIINHNAPNTKKILLLRDSFSCALLPFLSLSTKQVTTLDLRHFKKATVKDYLKSHDFDMVLIAYNPSAFDHVRFTFDEIT